jgi:diacylglycerol kinase (ATP)
MMALLFPEVMVHYSKSLTDISVMLLTRKFRLVIPVGRGNAFARDLDLHPEKWKEAVEAIAAGKKRMIDVGYCKTPQEQFYFINILGFGFVTDVAKTAFKLRVFGHLSYVLGVLYRTIFLKSFTLKIEVDGKMIERDNVFTEISNSRYTGKDFLMAPDALIDDGYLDITLLNKLSRRKILQALPKIFTGDYVKMKEVECFKAKKININTGNSRLLTPDGQLFGKTPLQIDCMEQALAVFIK